MSEDQEPDFEEVWRKGCAPGTYTLAIRDLAILPSVSPREIKTSKNSPAPVDEKTVRKYAKEMQAGDEFPPILVGALSLDKPSAALRKQEDLGALLKTRDNIGKGPLPLLVLIDGMHRTMARQSVSNFIAARVIAIGDLAEARWLAISENCAHGLNLKASEKRKKFHAYMRARKYIDPQTRRVKSLRTMAVEVGCSHEDVRRKLKDHWPDVYEHLRKRDNEVEAVPVPDFEELSRMRAAKVQRELADGAVNFARAALANGQRLDDQRMRLRVADVLENAAASLREGREGGPVTIDNWDPDREPLPVEDMTEYATSERPTETEA